MLAYLAIQQIESNILEPLVMEEAVSLHPAAVIAAVMLVVRLSVSWGAILAVPAGVVAATLISELWFRRLEKGNEHVGKESEGEEACRTA